jgi:hypothetical protein
VNTCLGRYNVPDHGTFVRLYLATRLGVYFCMYYFVHYHFEAMITWEVLELAPLPGAAGRGNVDAAATASSGSSSASGQPPCTVPAAVQLPNLDMFDSWEAPAAWIVTLLFAVVCVVQRGLPTAIAGEVCGGCPFAKVNRASSVSDEVRTAGVGRWAYWSLGVIIGSLLMATSLPEVFHGWDGDVLTDDVAVGLVTHGFILWWKLVLGVIMVVVHTGMMKSRTLRHNSEAISNGRGRPKATDAGWRSNKAICQIVQMIHLMVWVPYFFSHGIGEARPTSLVVLDGMAIGLLLCVNLARMVLW